MYGKLFSGAFTGSLFGSGPTVFAVWAYVIANAYDSHIELNPRLLSACIGTDTQDIQRAIDFLCQPDPDSRNPDERGARLVRMDAGGFQYFVPSWEKYQAMRHAEERRAQNRAAQAKYRASKQPSSIVSTGKHESAESAHVDVDVDVKNNTCATRTVPAGFMKFWGTWPSSERKVAKSACCKLWTSRRLEPLTEEICNHVAALRTSEKWRSGFEPAPLKYLGQRRWEDGNGEAAPAPWSGAVN